MDFRSFPKDRYSYDIAYVFIDRLTKRPISIPYYKDINALKTARLFINYVFR